MIGRAAFRLSTGAWLVASAAAPAIAGTIAAVPLFAIDTLPFVISMARAKLAVQQLYGYTSLRHELLDAIGSLLRNVFLGPFLTVPLGFAGACLFLLPAFWLAERRPSSGAFMAAGAGAGAAHALSGVALTQFDGLMSSTVVLVMGYLPYGGDLLGTVAFGVGTVVAGAVSGKLYWKLRSG